MSGKMKNKRLRMAMAIVMCLALIGAVLPVVSYADEGENVIQQDNGTVEEENIQVEDILLDEELLLEEYIEVITAEVAEQYSSISTEALGSVATGTTGRTRGSRLTGINKTAYDILKRGVEAIAAGDSASTEIFISYEDLFPTLYNKKFTAADLNVSAVVQDGEITEAAIDALQARFSGLDMNIIVNALMYDLPYALFWYDKTPGAGLDLLFNSGGISATMDGEWKIFWTGVNGYTFKFNVAVEYASGQYQTDVSKIKSIRTAVQRAATIVDEAKSMSDYQKLVYYRDRICALVKYNDAATNSGVQYGNPWQLIYVFDGDASTNVVCEGYSKAFKYLCDLTEFNDSRIEAYIITGFMFGGKGEGGHMWNHVLMDDGKYYLVDLTNCDSGTIGAPDKLFLVGNENGPEQYMLQMTVDGVTKDVPSKKYTFPHLVSTDGMQMTFVFDTATLSTYDTNELMLSTSNYNSGGSSVELKSINTATVTVPYSTVYWTGAARTQTPTVKINIDGQMKTLEKGTDYDVSFKNNIARGTATVTVTGKGNYTGSASTTFTIARQPLKNAAVKVTLGYSGMYYTGKARTQNGATVVKATVGGKVVTLEQGKDYSISYKNNVNAGTATMVITGIGNYTGTHTETFKIYKQYIDKFSPNVSIKYPNMNYTGKARTQNGTTVVTATVAGKTVTLEQGKDYTISYKNNTNVGTATMTITGIGNFRGSVTKSFKIIPAKTNISGVTKKSATSVMVKWDKKDVQTTGYLLQYSTSKTFASDKNSIWITNPATVTRVISGLAKGKTYYFRIRTYKEVGTAKTKYYSLWSDTISIKL